MSKKLQRLLRIYTAAALVSLGALSYAAEDRLGFYRRESDYAASRAFEEAVDDAGLVSIALDDGSVCALDATKYRETAEEDLRWTVGEDEARAALAPMLTAESVRRVVRRSPGGRSLACYELLCTGARGETVRITVDASDGRQIDIEIAGETA